jgi:hypothetical protein
MALSFANDIRPLFRDSPDIDSMKEYGLESLILPRCQSASRRDLCTFSRRQHAL